MFVLRWFALSLLALGPTPLLAAEVFRDTAFFAREDGKMVPVGRIPREVEIVPLKATPDGQWLRVWWKEREGWIRARDVRGVDVSKLRAPAAAADATEELWSEKNVLRVDALLMARSVGIGFGLTYLRRTPFLEIFPEMRVDFGPFVYFFPSPVGGKAWQMGLLARGLHPVLGKLEVGGMFGGFWNRYAADDPFGFGDNIVNTVGVILGPTGTYVLAEDLRVSIDVRVLLASIVNTQLAFGLDWRF